ncbi:hypothetical protein LTR78_009918 [Recurvomyces mirabilis]|uniref:Uncharacterized protein n=1 Tax=Recurvomyces mirabilis TaxID=574656 RepID=A0AAE0WH55_9PEZI|nr:hypothetical protein LTR78_009918 [Recurvomyces mirabilis]KAK5160350.1 hypothetical protein LTS14_001362 [Recurvomyces mirabilis]
MAFSTDFMFQPGLDVTNSSSKRALVRRKIVRRRTVPGTVRTYSVSSSPKARNCEDSLPCPSSRSVNDVRTTDPMTWIRDEEQQSTRSAGDLIFPAPPGHHVDTYGLTINGLGYHFVSLGERLCHSNNPHLTFVQQFSSNSAFVASMQAYAARDLEHRNQCSTSDALARRIDAIMLINAKLCNPESFEQDAIAAAILVAIAMDMSPTCSSGLGVEISQEAAIHLGGFASLLAARRHPLPTCIRFYQYWVDIQTAGSLSAVIYDHRGHRTLTFRCLATQELVKVYGEAYAHSVRLTAGDEVPKTSWPARSSICRLCHQESEHFMLVAILLHCNISAKSGKLYEKRALPPVYVDLSLSGTSAGIPETLEAITYALLITAKAEEIGQAEGDDKAQVLLRCLYAYQRLECVVKHRLSSMFLIMLSGTSDLKNSLWTPEAFGRLVGVER